MLSLFELLPTDFNRLKRILTSFSNLHYCDGVVYDLNNSRVHELKGPSYQKNLNVNESILLLTLVVTIAENRTAMYSLHTEYLTYVTHVSGRMKRYSSIHAYMKDIMNTNSKMKDLKSKVLAVL